MSRRDRRDHQPDRLLRRSLNRAVALQHLASRIRCPGSCQFRRLLSRLLAPSALAYSRRCCTHRGPTIPALTDLVLSGAKPSSPAPCLPFVHLLPPFKEQPMALLNTPLDGVKRIYHNSRLSHNRHTSVTQASLDTRFVASPTILKKKPSCWPQQSRRCQA